MYEVKSAAKGEFLGRKVIYEAVSTQNVSCVRVLSIGHFFMRESGGQARIFGNN